MATKNKKARTSSKKPGDPCWDGYKQEGMKIKNGKKVPNCIPIEKPLTQKA